MNRGLILTPHQTIHSANLTYSCFSHFSHFSHILWGLYSHQAFKHINKSYILYLFALSARFLRIGTHTKHSANLTYCSFSHFSHISWGLTLTQNILAHRGHLVYCSFLHCSAVDVDTSALLTDSFSYPSTTVTALPAVIHNVVREYPLVVDLDDRGHVGGGLMGNLQLLGVEDGV